MNVPRTHRWLIKWQDFTTLAKTNQCRELQKPSPQAGQSPQISLIEQVERQSIEFCATLKQILPAPVGINLPKDYKRRIGMFWPLDAGRNAKLAFWGVLKTLQSSPLIDTLKTWASLLWVLSRESCPLKARIAPRTVRLKSLPRRPNSRARIEG